MKKLFILCLLIILSIPLNMLCSAQTSDSGDFSGTEGESTIATGGTVMATCTGNVPFRNLTVMGGFNNIIIDPTTGNLQLNIEIEKTTDKNILDFKLTTAFNPEEVITGLVGGRTIPLNDENLMVTLTSTNLATGETTNVGNQVRRLIEDEQGGRSIDVNNFIPAMGSLQVRTRNNLASGFIRVSFDNTDKAIERASEITGEDITIDENGEASLIARFDGIPINGSFQDLAGFDPENLPRGIMLGSIPTGINLDQLPMSLEAFDLPEGITIEDIVNQIPPGFNLQDVLNLPSGFSVEDLSDIPPFFGITPEDLGFLPEDFNLNDLINLPPGLNLSEIPADQIIDFIGVQIPEGINFTDIVNGILNGSINPSELQNIDPNDPNSICQDGMILPGLAPFIPTGFICPSNIPTSSSGGIPSDFDPSTICADGMVLPQFQPFVPSEFTCP